MIPTAAKRGWSTSSSLVGSDNGGCLDNMLHSVLKIKMKWTLSLFTFVLKKIKIKKIKIFTWSKQRGIYLLCIVIRIRMRTDISAHDS